MNTGGFNHTKLCIVTDSETALLLRSGTVSARGLFQFISNLVDLPKLDKWKLEELNRLLDPNNDNR